MPEFSFASGPKRVLIFFFWGGGVKVELDCTLKRFEKDLKRFLFILHGPSPSYHGINKTLVA